MAIMQHLLITALTAVICINAVTSSPLLGKAEESYRLNNPVTPVNYKIHLKTDFKEAKTEGEVNIILNTLEETKTLRIHAVDLEFKKEDVTLVLQTDPTQTIDITDIKPYEAGQFHELNLKTKLAKKSNYLLTIKFKGTLKEGSKGYYLLKFKSGKANKVMAVTFLSPIYARTVFPCFDEPELKATFDIKLTHDEDYDAYSNSKSIKSSKSLKASKMVTTEFAQTPIMSTYILAFALLPKGTFIDHEVKKDKKSSVSTNVLIRKDIKDQVEYLLPKTTSYLQELEKLTGVEYDTNLGKITHLTIPKSETGAMENWGLIIYGESGVVYDEANDPFSKTLAGQRVIAHELSHQWFGNLVTPKWWTDLWLKEGFASYMESVVMDAVAPGEFGTLKEYFAQIHHRYFKEDSSSNNRAMNTPVEKPEDIEKNFDVVQYEKGAQLLYMLEHIIGSELFKKGVQNYVKRNQRQSVTPDDLWEALQQIIDKNKDNPILGGKKVADIGNSWISKAGYPVVHVTFDADKKKLKFRQERFLTTNAKKAIPSPFPKSKWMVPINFITDKTTTKNIDTAPTHWLETQKLEVDYEDIKFVIANNEQTGYYRVNYDDSNWKAISDHLNTEEEPVVSTVTQAQLLDDAFTFAENGDLKYDVAIDLTRFLENVDEFLPWKPTSVYLMNIYDKISMTSTLEKYQKYLSKIAKKAFDKVLFNEKYEKNTDGILQEKLLPLMVRARSSEFVEKSEEIMNELKQKSSTVLKKFQRYVFCGAATTEFEYLMEQLKAKKSEHDKDDILFGLSCLSDIENINKALEEIEDKEDKFKFVKHVAELSPLIVYDNIENFKKAITDEKQVEEIMKILAARVGTEEQLEKLEKLNEEGKYDDLLELAKENHKWNNDNKDFHEWIEDNVDEDPTKPTPKPTTTPNPEPTPPETPEPPPDGALSVAVCLSMLVSTVIIAFLM